MYILGLNVWLREIIEKKNQFWSKSFYKSVVFFTIVASSAFYIYVKNKLWVSLRFGLQTL